MNKDVIVIGAGVSGLNASISASRNGSSVLLVEKEDTLGGKLRYSFDETVLLNSDICAREFIEKYIKSIESLDIDVWTKAFVTRISKDGESFSVDIITRGGIENVRSKSVVIATGAREKTVFDLSIFGTYPNGIYSSDDAIYLMNVLNKTIGSKCVVFGMSDHTTYLIDLLKRKGMDIVKIVDQSIDPMAKTKFVQTRIVENGLAISNQYIVKHINGRERLESVDIVKIDNHGLQVQGSERRIECDTLILSGIRKPSVELIKSLGLKPSAKTKGIVVDQMGMTEVNGLFASGEVVNPYDSINGVSLMSREVGTNASKYRKSERQRTVIRFDHTIHSVTPSMIDLKEDISEIKLFFRSNKSMKNVTLKVFVDQKEIYRKRYIVLKPSEMEEIELNLKGKLRDKESILELRMEQA